MDHILEVSFFKENNYLQKDPVSSYFQISCFSKELFGKSFRGLRSQICLFKSYNLFFGGLLFFLKNILRKPVFIEGLWIVSRKFFFFFWRSSSSNVFRGLASPDEHLEVFYRFKKISITYISRRLFIGDRRLLEVFYLPFKALFSQKDLLYVLHPWKTSWVSSISRRPFGNAVANSKRPPKSSTSRRP